MYQGALLIVLLPNAAASAAPTLTDRELVAQAEEEFREGINLRSDAEKARPYFRRAAAHFAELHRRGMRNAALYHNLGNASLLAGDLPRAILAYRRGLRLKPNDPALRVAMRAAREQVVYPASGGLGRPRGDSRPPWLPHVRTEGLLIADSIAYSLMWICLARWRMVHRGRLLVGALLGLSLAGLFAAWLMVRTQEEQEEETHPLAVICRDGVRLRRGDGPAFPPRYDTPLNRGVEARRLFARDGWVQIELASGEIGWVPRSAVLLSLSEKKTPTPTING